MNTVITQPDTLELKINELEEQLKSLKQNFEKEKQDNSVSIICFSGNWDKLFAALSIASGSLALGMDVNLFFTFWSLSALKKTGNLNHKKRSILQKMFNAAMPGGFTHAPLSKFNMAGLGKVFMRKIMKEKGVDDIDILFDEVIGLGAKVFICDTSAELFGINCQEFNVEKLKMCGSTTYLSKAKKSKISLFI